MGAYAIPDRVLTAHLQDEAVLLHTGSKRYFKLNATGAWIWKGLERGLERKEIVDELCQRFEVDRETAESSLDEHLEKLREAGLLEMTEDGDASPDGPVGRES